MKELIIFGTEQLAIRLKTLVEQDGLYKVSTFTIDKSYIQHVEHGLISGILIPYA